MHRSVVINQSHGFWSSLKRTLFMASLYFRLIREYDPSEDLLKEFNQIFFLVINPKSLSFPAMICPMLWRDKTVNDVVSLCDAGDTQRAVELVYGKIPRFLRYLDRDTMLRDVERVILRTRKIQRYA